MLTLNHSRLVSLGQAAGLVARVEAQPHSAVAGALPLFLSSSLYTAPLSLQPRSLAWRGDPFVQDISPKIPAWQGGPP